MRYLFWNTRNEDVDYYILKMIKEYTPTIIALAEYNKDTENLIKSVKSELDIDYAEIVQLACTIKVLIKRKLVKYVKPYNDSTNYSINIIPYNSYVNNHIVTFVHLPSKMYPNEEKNRYLLGEITSKIDELDSSKSRKVLIFGDFNSNPYEKPMTCLTGCNAVSSRDVARKISRIEKSENKSFYYYYNPMWNFLGDSCDPYGTYYYYRSDFDSIYWNTFDQFVVSPELISDIEEIKIIKTIGRESLCRKNGVPNVSDHFPLYFKLGGN